MCIYICHYGVLVLFYLKGGQIQSFATWSIFVVLCSSCMQAQALQYQVVVLPSAFSCKAFQCTVHCTLLTFLSTSLTCFFPHAPQPARWFHNVCQYSGIKLTSVALYSFTLADPSAVFSEYWLLQRKPVWQNVFHEGGYSCFDGYT